MTRDTDSPIGLVVPQHSAVLPGYIPIVIYSNHLDIAKECRIPARRPQSRHGSADGVVAGGQGSRPVAYGLGKADDTQVFFGRREPAAADTSSLQGYGGSSIRDCA
jgi:hypothetical protein